MASSMRGSDSSSSARLAASDRFADTESSIERGHPEVQIFFDQERAAALGLTVKQVSDRFVG